MHDSVWARVCVCVCVRVYGSLSFLTGSQAADGWVQLSQSSIWETERKKERKTEILKKRCRYFGAIKHHWHIFHSSYFFLLNVPLFSFHKAVFFSFGLVGVWLEERQWGYHGNKAHHRYEHPWWRTGEAITVSHWPHFERERCLCVCYGMRSNRGCAVLFSILWTKVWENQTVRVSVQTHGWSCSLVIGPSVGSRAEGNLNIIERLSIL